jgi:hypothetical protein
VAWDILSPDFAAIDIGEVDDRRTINIEHAPATNPSLSLVVVNENAAPTAASFPGITLAIGTHLH